MDDPCDNWETINPKKFLLERIDGFAATLWNNRVTTFILLSSPYLLSLYLWFRPPLPGVAAVLLGGIAAIMTFRDMHHTHKILFTGAILLLVFLESRDLRIDRAESDKKALNDRASQDLEFKNIRDAQDEDFRKTAEGLRAAITGIESTLKSANQTFTQTRPHGEEHFIGGIQVGLSADSSVRSDNIVRAGVHYVFTSLVVNDGSENAYVLRMLRRVYVSKPDNISAQAELVTNFEQEWNQVRRESRRTPGTLALAHSHGFRTDERTFNQDELEQMSQGGTIYQIRRLEYSDSTGIWISEDCNHLQVGKGGVQVGKSEIDLAVTHPCLLFNENRLRAPTK